MGTPRIKDRIDKVHDESNSRYELASMVVELQEEVAALTTQRDQANTKFENHTKAVAEWTSTAAEIIGLGEHGKVTPDQILDQLIYGRQWASDMQTKLTAAEAQRDELQKRIGYTAVPTDKPCESPPVAWLAEEQGYFPGDGGRELWWEPNKHAVLWKQTPLYKTQKLICAVCESKEAN